MLDVWNRPCPLTLLAIKALLHLCIDVVSALFVRKPPCSLKNNFGGIWLDSIRLSLACREYVLWQCTRIDVMCVASYPNTSKYSLDLTGRTEMECA